MPSLTEEYLPEGTLPLGSETRHLSSTPMTAPLQFRSLNPFRTLAKYRTFRLFWFGQTTSLVGSWMQTVAVGWTALDRDSVDAAGPTVWVETCEELADYILTGRGGHAHNRRTVD